MTALLLPSLAVVAWALLSVISRIVLVRFSLDPWMFSFLQLAFGGAALLLIGLPKAAALNSFTKASTWALGGLRVLSAALYTTVLASISVLEAGVLGALNLPVVAAAIWVLLGQPPRRWAWLGHALAICAVIAMAIMLDSDQKGLVLVLMGINALCLAAMNLIAERHPENANVSLAARAWFSGVVLSITAVLFAVLRLVQGGDLSSVLEPTLLVASAAVGITLRAPSMFLAFWALSTAGAQSYTAAIALLPLFGMLFEQFSIAIGLLEVSRFQADSLYLAFLALAGTLLVWTSKGK